ncbi:DoxX family protein [Ulvibacterium sp.]|uniref:DoxX family protein n=1 Tax=Ulvibacterium sp. TaxID=2665914 RepID=UPI003CC509F1
MAKFHEETISKTQKIIGYGLSILFSVQIFMAGILKVIQEADIVERMNNVPNWGDKLMFVGILELILLALYWIPKTQKLGFYLLCAFVGGVIVAEVAAGTHVEQGAPPAPLVGIVTAVLLYAGTILRKPSMLK